MDIVQTEGEEIKPFDTITRMLPCTFSISWMDILLGSWNKYNGINL